jgi:ubiquinone/menaquinone biosynthesis C-methylase UbiE
MKVHDQERDWNELAELDPYWAILTAPGTRFGAWDSDAFFATGTTEIDGVMRRAAQLGHPQGRHRALDFGCGLGRLTRALAGHFDECIGVDISEGMVHGAQQLNADVRGASFVINAAEDLRCFGDQSFDLVYSVIVLQHVPDRAAIEGYISEFCRVLRPGGLAVFQLPSHIPKVYRLGVGAAFLYNRLRLMPIAMSSMSDRDVVALVTSRGARVLHVETVGASGLLNAGLRNSTYYMTR